MWDVGFKIDFNRRLQEYLNKHLQNWYDIVSIITELYIVHFFKNI